MLRAKAVSRDIHLKVNVDQERFFDQALFNNGVITDTKMKNALKKEW
jgi:hypothetical protein